MNVDLLSAADWIWRSLNVLFWLFVIVKIIEKAGPVLNKLGVAVFYHAINFGASIGMRPDNSLLGSIGVVLFYILVGLLRLLGLLKYIFPDIYYRPDYESALKTITSQFAKKGIVLEWIEVHIDTPFVRIFSLKQKGKKMSEYRKVVDELVAKDKLPGNTCVRPKSGVVEFLVSHDWIADTYTPA